MYCYNCGKFNQESDIYCYNCGVMISSPVVSAEVSYEISEGSKVKVRRTLQKHLKSPVILIALLFMTASIILGWFAPNTVYNKDTTPKYEDEGDGFIAPISVSSMSDSTSDSFDAVVNFEDIFDMSLPWVVSGYLIYFFALTKKDKMKIYGLGMARVLAFINKICSYILGALLCVSGMFSFFETPDGGAALVIAGFFFVLPLLGGIGFVIVLWAHKLAKTVYSIKSIYETGEAHYPITVFLGVSLFIIGGFLSIALFNPTSLSALSAATCAVSCVLFGIQLFRIRSAMKALAREQIEDKIPVYAGQIINNNVMI